ncbi:MAG: ribose 5-phosphate isomerase B [Ruminococcaceae bacterium]|nr:ribose 5-phosphate isomerase B [Oscillospiraceae bacterium]
MENKKKIVLGADHAGYLLKNFIAEQLKKEGYEVTDVGTNSPDSCDYPVYAEKTCSAVLDGTGELAVLVCGTGIGMSIAANKINGVRAACCSDIFSAKFTRAHNDSNVLCIGARVLGEGLAWELVKVFIETEFEGGKHARRVAMLTDIENKQK